MDEKFRGVAQLAARIVRDDEAPGSSPGTPTNSTPFSLNIGCSGMKRVGKQKFTIFISVVVLVFGILFSPRPKIIQVACTSNSISIKDSTCGKQLIWEPTFITTQISNNIARFIHRNCTGFSCGYYGNDLIVSSPKPGESRIETGKSIADEELAITIMKRYFPEVNKIKKTQSEIGQTMNIHTKENLEKDGWKILFWTGSGDCAVGCLNDKQWYFIVEKIGSIRKVGAAERVFNSRKNAIDESGVYMPYFLDDCPSKKVLDCTNLNDPDRHWKCQQPYLDWLKTTCLDVTILQP